MHQEQIIFIILGDITPFLSWAIQIVPAWCCVLWAVHVDLAAWLQQADLPHDLCSYECSSNIQYQQHAEPRKATVYDDNAMPPLYAQAKEINDIMTYSRTSL